MATEAARKLLESAVGFGSDLPEQPQQYVYGLPGFDDVPRPCLGIRRRGGETPEDGRCLSVQWAVHLLGISLLAAFFCWLCPWAWRWLRFAQLVRQRGALLPCSAKPERVRHEWCFEDGHYLYAPVYEVKLQWEQPSGKKNDLAFTGIHEVDHLFDGTIPKLMKGRELVSGSFLGPTPKLRAAPRGLYEQAAGKPREEPDPGVWKMEVPSHWPHSPTDVQLSALADSEHPDAVVPLAHGHKDLVTVISWRHGLGYCLCGCCATLPALAICSLKLAQPLLPIDGAPLFMEGYVSNATKSRFVTPEVSEGRWSLSTTRQATEFAIGAIFVFCVCIALPWWVLCVRCILEGVTDLRGVASESGSEAGADEISPLISTR